MSDESLTSVGNIAGYAYPPDLARHVMQRWAPVQTSAPHTTVPEFATLKHFLSACYQASLMREEERPVTFRAVLAPPELFAPDGIRRKPCSGWPSVSQCDLMQVSCVVCPSPPTHSEP
jgi:hypothetical protein